MKSLERLHVNQKLWDGIFQIQDKLKITDETMSREANLNWQKFSFCKQNNLGLPFHNLEKLANFLSINIEKLISGDFKDCFEKKSLELQYQNNIHDKYQIGSGSKTLTLRHLLKISRKYGLYDSVINKFSLPPLVIEAQVDFEISVQIVADITDYITTHAHLSDDDLREIAELNAFYFKDSIFGKLLQSSKSPLEIYEHLVYLTSFLENNWYYKIDKISDKKIFLNSYASERLTETFKRKDYSTYNFTRFRILVTGVLTRYIGLTDAKTQIVRSVHQGDNYCQFMIDTSSSRPLSSDQSLYLQ